MGVLVDALKSVDFLHGEPDDVIQAFLVAGKCVDREKGEMLWRSGSPASSIVVPVTGEAKTVSHGPDGREFIDRFIGPGECMGLQSALDGLPHPTGAEISRAGAFFELSRSNANRLFERFPTVRARAGEAVGRMYRRSVRDREDVVLRLARFLVEHSCVRQTAGAKVLVHATQSEIAARLGTVREVVARTLSDFLARGLVSRSDGGIYIDDWKGLHDLAGLEFGAISDRDPADSMAPNVRTARFYLPRSEAWTRARETDDVGCFTHLGDLAPCERVGCPAAREEMDRQRRAVAAQKAAETAKSAAASTTKKSAKSATVKSAVAKRAKKRGA